MCLLRLDLLAVWYKQWGQEKGFSPVWVRICLSISERLGVLYEQRVQLWTFRACLQLRFQATPPPSSIWVSVSRHTCRKCLTHSVECRGVLGYKTFDSFTRIIFCYKTFHPLACMQIRLTLECGSDFVSKHSTHPAERKCIIIYILEVSSKLWIHETVFLLYSPN